MNKFKIGDEVKWNNKKDSDFLIFSKRKEEFLKSKEVHTIRKIDGITCKLEGSQWVYDLTWFDLIEGDKDE